MPAIAAISQNACGWPEFLVRLPAWLMNAHIAIFWRTLLQRAVTAAKNA